MSMRRREKSLSRGLLGGICISPICSSTAVWLFSLDGCLLRPGQYSKALALREPVEVHTARENLGEIKYDFDGAWSSLVIFR